jgi:hypothetical protein
MSMRRNPNGLMHRVRQVVRAERDRVAVELVAGSGVVVKTGCRTTHVALRFHQPFAAVQGLGHRQHIGLFAQPSRQRAEQTCPRTRRQTGPRPLQGAPRGVNCRIHLRGTASGATEKDFASPRIPAVQLSTVCAGAPWPSMKWRVGRSGSDPVRCAYATRDCKSIRPPPILFGHAYCSSELFDGANMNKPCQCHKPPKPW